MKNLFVITIALLALGCKKTELENPQPKSGELKIDFAAWGDVGNSVFGGGMPSFPIDSTAVSIDSI